MNHLEEVFRALTAIPGLAVLRREPIAGHTRFALGGPAEILAMADCAEAFIAAAGAARSAGVPVVTVGGGTNLVVSDAGFDGLVLKFAAGWIEQADNSVNAQAGAWLQELVDFTVGRGLGGLETLAGIPGTVGGAIHGNAGAYGHSISERVSRVFCFDGEARRELDRSACEFGYRESIFKRNKNWVIFEARLVLAPASPDELRATAGRILDERNKKFPPEMKCAGSIFKNLVQKDLPGGLVAAVPSDVIREGKIPAAWFLEQAGARGMARGGIRVADYHANLVYNTGSGTAGELRELIADLKDRVRARFGLELEEEVQYVGFDNS